jgi:hypothetical protein
MPYEVKINNVGTVTFDKMPTPQDIDEVAQAHGWSPQDTKPQKSYSGGEVLSSAAQNIIPSTG